MKAKGQPAKTGRGPAKRARFAHGVHVGQPLSAYVSTNSGEKERRDEIMGPTASRPQSGRLLCPGISDFGGHRVLGAGAQDPGDRKPLWPPLTPSSATFTPTFSALDPASLYSGPSQGNLICHIALHFKTAVEITGHFFPS